MGDSPNAFGTGQTPPPRRADQRPWWKKKRYAIPLAVFGGFFLLVLAVIISVGGETEPEVRTVREVVTEAVTETVTEPATAEEMAELDDRSDQLDEDEQRLDERKERLDQRKQALDEREAAISGDEDRVASNTFTDGVYLVGDDIEPGTYRTSDSGCYWQRSSGLSGEFDDIIANGNTTGPAVVEISSDDVAFSTQGGCEWTLQ